MAAIALTLSQICNRLGMTKREVYARACKDRTFPAMIKRPNGGGIAFDADEIAAWAKHQAVARGGA